MNRPGNLSRLFAAASMLAVAYTTDAYAQTAPVAPQEDLPYNNAQTDTVQQNTVQPQAEVQTPVKKIKGAAFLPPEFCAPQMTVPANVSAIVSSDDRFASIESWKDTPNAKAIVTQRLCRDGIRSIGYDDSVLSDVLRRLLPEPWLAETIRPFLESDPAYYWDMKGTYRSGVLSTVLDKLSTINIRLDAVKKFAANGDEYYSRNDILDNYEDYAARSEAPEILKAIIAHSPLAYWRPNGRTDNLQLKERLKADPTLRPTAASLLNYAMTAEYPDDLLSNYDHFSDMPEAHDILKAIVVRFPLAFLRAQASGYLPDSLKNDPLTRTDAATMLRLASNKSDAQTLVLDYSLYATMPEARNILARAIQNSPVNYWYQIEQKKFPADIINDRTLRPSAQSIMALINGKESYTRTIITHYKEYADFPEARAILQAAIDKDPLSFFQERKQLPPALRDDATLVPSAKVLLEIAKKKDRDSSYSNMQLYNYYDQYAQLPEAREITQLSMDTAPLAALNGIAQKRVPKLLLDDPTLRPSAAALLRDARGENHLQSDLISYFSRYEKMPEAMEIIQAAIDNDPLAFYSYKTIYEDKIPAAFKMIHPSIASIKKLLSDPSNANFLIKYYDEYSRDPDAHKIVATALQQRPAIYFDLKADKKLSDSIVRDPSLKPDATLLMKTATQGLGISELIRNYGQYADMPEAPQILKTALDTWPAKSYEGARGSKNLNFKFPPALLPEVEGRDLSPADSIMLYHIIHHPRLFETEYTLDNHIGELLRLSWQKDVQSQLFGMAANTKGEHIFSGDFLNTLSDPGNADALDQMDTAFRTRLLAVFSNSITKQSGGLFLQAKVIFNPNSWIIKHNALDANLLGNLFALTLRNGSSEGIDVLNSGGIDQLLKNPETAKHIHSAVQNAAVNTLYSLTRDGKPHGIDRPGLKINYETLARWAGESVGSIMQDDPSYNSTTINILNALHDEDDKVRFAMLDHFTAGQYLMLMRNDVSLYYTSTFNRLFNGARAGLLAEPATRAKLFSDRHSAERLNNFVTLATYFGRLDELLDSLTDAEIHSTLDTAFDSLPGRGSWDSDGRLTRSMTTIAAIMDYARRHDRDAAGLERLLITKTADADGIQAVPTDTYGLIAAVYVRDNGKNHFPNFFAKARALYDGTISHYTQVKLPALPMFDAEGRTFGRVVFYSDKDGQSSYGNFVSTYKHDPAWHFADHKTYITFSRNGVMLLANKPAEREQGNKDIDDFLKGLGDDAHISLLIHRGHSFHVEETLSGYLNGNIKFMWLGSCHSSSIWNHMQDSPDMQFIYSQNVGTKLVNDPMIKYITDRIAQKQDLNWIDARQAALRMGGEKRGKDYIFPDGSLEYALHMTSQLLKNQDGTEARANDLRSTAANAMGTTLFGPSLSQALTGRIDSSLALRLP